MNEIVRWPNAPKRWSYSAFRVARECPRRWALREADVTQVNRAKGQGSPFLGRVRGRTCHAVLEKMLLLYRDHNGLSIAPGQMLSFWKQHLPAGILATTRSMMNEEITRVANAESLDKLASRELTRQSDARLKDMVGFINSAFRIALGLLRQAENKPRDTPSPLGVGMHPEVSVSTELGSFSWIGHIDVVAVLANQLALFDFKTGKPNPGDRGQLELYALLFARDRVKNPDAWIVDSLALLYSNGEIDQWSAPNADALAKQASDLIASTQSVITELGVQPPVARPDAARCAGCEVRTHCDTYWEQSFTKQRFGTVDLRIRVDGLTSANEIRGKPIGATERVVVLFRPERPESVAIGKVIRVSSAAVVFEGSEGGESIRVLEANAANIVVE